MPELKRLPTKGHPCLKRKIRPWFDINDCQVKKNLKIFEKGFQSRDGSGSSKSFREKFFKIVQSI